MYKLTDMKKYFYRFKVIAGDSITKYDGDLLNEAQMKQMEGILSEQVMESRIRERFSKVYPGMNIEVELNWYSCLNTYGHSERLIKHSKINKKL